MRAPSLARSQFGDALIQALSQNSKARHEEILSNEINSTQPQIKQVSKFRPEVLPLQQNKIVRKIAVAPKKKFASSVFQTLPLELS